LKHLKNPVNSIKDSWQKIFVIHIQLTKILDWKNSKIHTFVNQKIKNFHHHQG